MVQGRAPQHLPHQQQEEELRHADLAVHVRELPELRGLLLKSVRKISRKLYISSTPTILDNLFKGPSTVRRWTETTVDNRRVVFPQIFFFLGEFFSNFDRNLSYLVQ